MAWSGDDRRRPQRHYLGKSSGFGQTVRLYQTREALEVDETEGYDVVRRRVYYDDILLVTHHQYVGVAFVVAASVLVLMFGALALALGRAESWPVGLWIFALTGLPFLVVLLLRLALKVDAVTVYGRRTKAQIHFTLRKARALAVFNQVCRAVKETQDRIAREAAPRAPRPAPAPAPPPA